MDRDFNDAIEFADEAVAALGFDPGRASDAVRNVYLITQLEFEVVSGGFRQWLVNSSGRYATDTVRALQEIGAFKCAEIVSAVLRFFPTGVPPLDTASRTHEAVVLNESSVGDAWSELGNQLLEWPDDVNVLLRDYVARHADQFRRAMHR